MKKIKKMLVLASVVFLSIAATKMVVKAEGRAEKDGDNNTRATAETLGNKETVDGTITLPLGGDLSIVNDEDWYCYTLTESGCFEINMTLNKLVDSGEIKEGFRVRVFLNNSETYVYNNAFMSSYSSVHQTFKKGDKIYIQVRSTEAQGFYYKAYAPNGYGYTLSINNTNDDSWESEYNDTIIDANDVTGKAKWYGLLRHKDSNSTYDIDGLETCIGTSDQSDWYKLSVSKSGYYAFHMIPARETYRGVNGGWRGAVFVGGADLNNQTALGGYKKADDFFGKDSKAGKAVWVNVGETVYIHIYPENQFGTPQNVEYIASFSEVLTEKKLVAAATEDEDGYYQNYIKDTDTAIGDKIAIKKIAEVTVDSETYSYTGNDIMPSVTVKDSAGDTISSDNYTVTYMNCKHVGKATVRIIFIGDYQGMKELTFNISLDGTSVAKTTATKNSIKIKLKKNTNKISGYEIEVSTSKLFTKKATKRITVKKKTATVHTMKALKKNKTYYVRVRTYIVQNKKKVYSEWSKLSKVKTKK